MDSAAAEAALARIAEPLALSTLDATWVVYDIVCESMAAAARVHIVEKGRDSRRYAMIAMGGAGPAHAARVARKLGASARCWCRPPRAPPRPWASWWRR